MKNLTKIIKRIESYYVGDDCIQDMIPYKNAITILSQDGILFHNKVGSNLYINKYMEDERRKQFPYSNIPIHYSKRGLVEKIIFTNQLFEFEKPYIRIFDGYILESFAVKDNDQALLINSIMQTDKYTKHMTYEELLQFVAKKDDDEQIYYVYTDGYLCPDGSKLLPTEEQIYKHIKEQFKKNVKDFREYQQEHTDAVGRYLEENPWFLNYIEKSINNLDTSLINFNILIEDVSTLLILRIHNNDIKIQKVDVRFIKKDDFKVDIYNIPVNKYTLEQLKFMPKIYRNKEPKISLKLNPGITKQDIQESKKMVKTLRK